MISMRKTVIENGLKERSLHLFGLAAAVFRLRRKSIRMAGEKVRIKRIKTLRASDKRLSDAPAL